jgi:septum formation protein
LEFWSVDISFLNQKSRQNYKILFAFCIFFSKLKFQQMHDSVLHANRLHAPAARILPPMPLPSFRDHPVILASASPRRRDLLTEAGYDFEVDPANVSEVHDEKAGLHALTMENASAKAWHVGRLKPHRLVIGADTLVAIDGCALTKPADMDEARSMLRRLRGKTHEVCTAVALVCQSADIFRRFEVVTRVTFKSLTDPELEEYLTLINPLDKAGGYAAQEHGDRIIAGVDGSWTNVVGLPMEALSEQLAFLQVFPKPAEPDQN